MGRTASTDVSWAGVALVRPERSRDALLCAEDLLRSGGFALVVLDGMETAGAERVPL
jgi:hypothetical protein